MILKTKDRYSISIEFIESAAEFLHPLVKLKNSFPLLLKLILNKFNIIQILIILRVTSDGLICVSANPIMSYFIILTSLAISCICFESDLTL